jgi:hypothetical protein
MEERIAELEHSLRWMRVAMLFGLLLMAVLAFAAFRPFQQDQVLRVRGLIVTDDSGHDRILIGAPVPASPWRVRTDSAKVRKAWASRFPNPDQYMKWYSEYRNSTNGILILGEDGFDRVVLGDPVPDPNIGKRIGADRGLVINDDEGFERSGYGLIDVNGKKRVVLGLDSNRGTEGLTLVLYDGGRVGMNVRSGSRSIFLGNAPAGDLSGVGREVFSGVVFRKGQTVTRVVTSTGK